MDGECVVAGGAAPGDVADVGGSVEECAFAEDLGTLLDQVLEDRASTELMSKMKDLLTTRENRAELCKALDLRRGRMALSQTSYHGLCDVMDSALTVINREGDFQSAKTLMQMSANFHVEDDAGERVFLQESIKTHGIWKNLRYWDEAYFDALNSERLKVEINRPKWKDLNTFEQDDEIEKLKNIAFGQLGTFALNMLTFGNDVRDTKDFVLKQCRINDLRQDHVQSLLDSIDGVAKSIKDEQVENARLTSERFARMRKEMWRRQQREQWARARDGRTRVDREVKEEEVVTINPVAPLASTNTAPTQPVVAPAASLVKKSSSKKQKKVRTTTVTAVLLDDDDEMRGEGISTSSDLREIRSLMQFSESNENLFVDAETSPEIPIPRDSNATSSDYSGSASRVLSSGSFRNPMGSLVDEDRLEPGVCVSDGSEDGEEHTMAPFGQELGSLGRSTLTSVQGTATQSQQYVPDYSRIAGISSLKAKSSSESSIGKSDDDSSHRLVKKVVAKLRGGEKKETAAERLERLMREENEITKMRKDQWLQAKRKRWEKAQVKLQFHMEHQATDKEFEGKKVVTVVPDASRIGGSAPLTFPEMHAPVHLSIIGELDRVDPPGTQDNDEKSSFCDEDVVVPSNCLFRIDVQSILEPQFETESVRSSEHVLRLPSSKES